MWTLYYYSAFTTSYVPAVIPLRVRHALLRLTCGEFTADSVREGLHFTAMVPVH